MKKSIFLAALLLASVGAWAQTFVSTQPQKRNALIEEYTGVNCQYCPLGHKVVDEMMATYPGHVFGINIHQGSFASRYTTQWGNALAQQAGIMSYPSATLNRHAFAGAGTQIAPGECYRYVPQVLKMNAPVNVAAVAEIDPVSRLLTVQVEAYYTANSASGYNLLNVALLQNNVYSSQAGGSSYYPENMVNGQYCHKHILRDLLTGQWGDTIRQTTAGSFFSKEYAYVIPPTIGDLNITNMDDLSIVVFVCEGHKEVLNATQAIVKSDKAYLAYTGIDQEVCQYDVQPYVTVVNPTESSISNLRFSVDGTELVRTKTIAPFRADTVQLPAYALDPLPESHAHYSASRTVTFTGYTTGGSQVAVNGEEHSFEIADFDLFTTPGPLTLTIHYDGYPTEVSFDLFGYEDCSYYYRNTGLSNQSSQTVSYTLSPANVGVYRLRLSDVGGDGLSGNISVTDADGNTLFSRNGSNLTLWDYYFNFTTAGSDSPLLGITEIGPPKVAVYPNPAHQQLNVEAEGLLRVELMDPTGRRVALTTGQQLDVSTLPAGLYLLRATTQEGSTVTRVVIN